MKKKNLALEKIPLDALISILIKAYESGADYIDIVQIENEQNTIGLLTKESYYRTEEEKDDDDEYLLDLIQDNSILTEEDINKLII